jgi:hypothetical protein
MSWTSTSSLNNAEVGETVKVANLPPIDPALLAKMKDPLMGLLIGGAGLGLTGGVLEGKGIGTTIKDTLKGGLAGAVGGAGLGYALSKVGPLAHTLSQATQGAGLSGLLARLPLNALSALSNRVVPAVGGPVGAALLGMGVLGALGAALRGASVRRNQQQGSIIHDMMLGRNIKISSNGEEISMTDAELQAYSRMKSMFHRKYANILNPGGEGSDIADTAQQSAGEETQHRVPSQAQLNYAGPPLATRTDVHDLGRLQMIENIKTRQHQELERRRMMAQQIIAPMGGHVGGAIGERVAELYGKKKAPGIKGLFGYTEDVKDKAKYKEIGSLIGTAGAGAITGKAVDYFGKDPRIDAYLDRLGL